MELIRHLSGPGPRHRGCVLSIGNYDGVHLGHRRIIDELAARGRELSLPAVIMTFEPYPREYFQKQAAPPRISGRRDKLGLLAAAGVDRVWILRFDRRLAATAAEDFVRRYVVDALGARHVVIGDDFRFGAGRRGDIVLLRCMAEAAGFGVSSVPTFVIDGERVSSSRIRACLAAGDLDTAARLLGRPFSICGRVAHGDRRGRSWGFPTLNIVLHQRTPPMTGVFAVQVEGVGERPWPGVANLGRRPTVGGDRLLLEVHLLDFHGDLYGRAVEVRFLRRLRDERRFASFDELRAQIGRDVAGARAWFEVASGSAAAEVR